MSLWKVIKGEEPGFFESASHAMQGKGHYGEYLTEFALNHQGLPGKFFTYNNLIVPRKGKVTSTSELDVVMLHEKGVYVFESKNYSGWIFGSADQQKWTASYQNGHKEHFYNPIKQNRAHVRTLAEYMMVPESVFKSYIVFSERCELKKVPTDNAEVTVLQRDRLISDLKKDLSWHEPVFDYEEFARLKLRLDALTVTSTDDAREAHVKEVQAVADGKICPYCGSKLVERHRKSDGGTFIGCSGFPKCRYTRNEW